MIIMLLVQFVSLSTWKQIGETIGNAEPDTYIRILSEKRENLDGIECDRNRTDDCAGA